MKLIKNISLLFLACLVLMSVVPFDVLANDAGDPKIMDPKITATVFADTTTAKPGDVINLTFSIRNDSKRPLYIEEIALESSNIYYEMIDTDYLDIEDQIIDPAETIIVEHKYKTRFDLYSLYAGEMTIVLSPVIHCYYYSPAVNDKQANGRKLYIDINTSIRFTWDFPHDLISPLDIHYEVQKKVNSTSIYNFTVTIQNKSNKTMYDLAIRSNINQIYDDSFSNLKLRSLDPNETKTFYYTYDNESSYRPYYGEIPVVIYLIGEHENDDNLYGNISNIEPLIFHTDTKEKPAIQLEYELICDVKEAHYLEEIPYQLVVYNPTATTFDNIHLQGSGSDDTITIRPKETIIVDLSHLERFDIYDKHLYELFDDTVIIKPPSMKFNEIWYDVDEWWNNYDKSDLLELKISMPPQEENIDVKVFFSSNDKSKIYLQLDNHTGKAIELDFIGCPENAFIKSYFDQNLIKSNHTNLQELTIVADAIIETDEGNFVELFMLFDENSRDSITWLYDLYPVSSSTPTIT
ncbi:MAG: hypothetical protein KAQ68_01710, partial [Clostridiales bacterium]|nr:hypothetical protein [Clostridiales bacterium]